MLNYIYHMKTMVFFSCLCNIWKLCAHVIQCNTLLRIVIMLHGQM